MFAWKMALTIVTVSSRKEKESWEQRNLKTKTTTLHTQNHALRNGYAPQKQSDGEELVQPAAERMRRHDV